MSEEFIEKKKTIDLSFQYKFPDILKIVRHNGKILIIAPETANWIVLDNESQLTFFNLLKFKPLGESIDSFNGLNDDVQQVLIQLEAKQFCQSKGIRKSDSKLSMLHFYLTNGCNMRCPHCYMWAGSKFDNELSFEEIQTLFNDFASYGGKLVVLSGGEICLRKDLLDIVKAAHDLGLKVQLISNGTLWSQSLIREVAKYISTIRISIDGYSEDVNKIVRGAGSFEKALNTIDSFVKLGVKTELAITPLYNKDLHLHIQDYVNFILGLKNKYAGYSFSTILSKDLLDGRDIKLSPKEKDEYREITNKIDYLCFGTNSADETFFEARKQRMIVDCCTYGELNVSSTGDIYFCSRVTSMSPSANIRTNSFSEIVELSQNAKRLANVDNLYPCRDCELKYICSGDCRLTYFEGFENINFSEEQKYVRTCSAENKSKFYDLMINMNDSLFE
jgi:radical SAM protein with 4Fe4S-binding SPASM domain